MPCSGDCMLSMPVHGEVSKGRLPVDYWNAIYMRYIYIYMYIYMRIRILYVLRRGCCWVGTARAQTMLCRV